MAQYLFVKSGFNDPALVPGAARMSRSLIVRRGRRSNNEFLPDGNGLRYVRHPTIRSDANNPG